MLAALKRDGWIESRRAGSHRVLVKGDGPTMMVRTWACPAMARIARDYGYTLAERRKLYDDQVVSTLRVELFFDDEAGN